jgi:flagellar basal-body rod protein FlgF
MLFAPLLGMQIGLYQSAIGMKSMMAYQNDLSANLARQSIVGNRSTITAFEILEEQDKQLRGNQGPIRPVGNKALPMAVQSVVNFSQGPLQRTNEELDFAIQGQSFFAVKEPSADGEGMVRYTRNGQFRLDGQGNVVASDGAQVMLEGNTPFIVDLNGSRKISVLTNGTIYVGDNNQPAGRLMMAHFDDPRQVLQATSTGRFEVMDETLLKEGTAPRDRVEQGYTEASNSDTITDMVNLVTVMRNYEMSQRSVTLQDEVTGKLLRSINEI